MTTKLKQKVLILISILFLYGCGTGPWFMSKKIYKTYKEDIYTLPTDSLKTNGYYIQVNELQPNVNFRDVIIFYKNGYTTHFRLSQSELKNNIESEITQNKNTTYKTLDWWKIYHDSIVIEHFADSNKEMFTSNHFQRGKILNDTLIELKYDDSSFLPIKFKFVKTDSLPQIKNKGRYLKKNWYLENINKNRH